MAFCSNCGAQIPDGSKFCTNCGTKIVSAPAPAAAAPQEPVQSFVPSVQETAYVAPVQETAYTAPGSAFTQSTPDVYSAQQESYYAQPVPQPYAAPQQEPYYGQPTQQPYAAPQQEPYYNQPMQQPYAAPQQEPAYAMPQYDSQPYSMPGQAYSMSQAAPSAPAQAKQKKSGGKGAGKIIAIIAIIAALAVGAVLLVPKLFGGKTEDDPNLGTYSATYAEMLGYEMEVAEIFDGEFTIELKPKGKCTIVVGDDKANGKWTLDGEDFSFSGGGLDCSGTLKDGAMELENVLDMGVQLKLYKDGKVPSDTSASDSAEKMGDQEPNAGDTETENNGTGTDTPEPAPEPTPEPAPEPDPNIGVYIGYSLSYEGYLLPLSDMDLDDFDMILNEDGSITVSSGGDSTDGTYTIDGESFHSEFYEDGEHIVLDGTIKDGVLTIPDFLGSGYGINLFKEGVTPTGELTSLNEILGISDDPDAGLTEVQAFWNGDWYGWWVMTSTTGSFAGNEGDWWDLCASIEVSPDGTAVITLWDEDCGEDEAMAVVDLTILPDGTTSNGTAMSESGWFYDMDVAHADWIIDPGLVIYDQMIWIEGYYENSDGSFDYDMYLRPWGITWDDTDEEDRPYYYEDWYLPLINEGKPMPLYMDIE